jgi:hypothetical protein
VVFAKLDDSAVAAPTAAHVTRVPAPRRRGFGLLDASLAVALVGAVVATAILWSALRSTEPDASATFPSGLTSPRPVAPRANLPAASEAAPSPTAPWLPDEPTALPTSAPPSSAGSLPAGVAGASILSPEDEAVVETLSRTVAARSEIDSSHLYQLEQLHARNPGAHRAAAVVEAVLDAAASQAAARVQPLDAVRYRERVTELLPDRPWGWRRLIALHFERRQWVEAERAARRALSAIPDESSLYVALAQALSRQGRDDDAADVLRRRVAGRDDPVASQMLASLEASLSSVAGLARRSSAHFTVMFEGQADDALGRSLVQTLEEKYVMLARTLDFEPTEPIPVILYPRAVFKAIGGPRWAAASFSHGDGRIRVGTRDLGAGFVPLDLERTLTHELTHAFVHAITRGAVPRDVNEGLAQHLSGERLGYRLDPARVAGSNAVVKVEDYYDSALSFVEYLLDRHRQSAMNEMLKVGGETGSVDKAFERAYGGSYQEIRQQWIRSLR